MDQKQLAAMMVAKKQNKVQKIEDQEEHKSSGSSSAELVGKDQVVQTANIDSDLRLQEEDIALIVDMGQEESISNLNIMSQKDIQIGNKVFQRHSRERSLLNSCIDVTEV